MIFAEVKRSQFPRFYFISDTTLLEILSSGSRPKDVIKHFQSGVFDGISDVRINEDQQIVSMISKEGEEVTLSTAVQISADPVEWLNALVASMVQTMRDEARRGAKEVYKMPVQEFLFTRPAQIALLGLQLKWTATVQSALVQTSRGKKGALTRALRSCNATLSELVQLTLRDDLSPMNRKSLETCITVYIHQRDAVQELIDQRVTDPKAFAWLKHCRFRWKESDQTLMIYVCDMEFEYGFEYLGVKERLVMTPLTDICYITLTQALGMYYGGAPAGPAGTGKTETTKDLGASLGKYVVVFNCSDQMDHKSLGKIFKGLAQVMFFSTHS